MHKERQLPRLFQVMLPEEQRQLHLTCVDVQIGVRDGICARPLAGP